MSETTAASGNRHRPAFFRSGRLGRLPRAYDDWLPPPDDDVDDWAPEVMCLNDLAALLGDEAACVKAEQLYIHAPFPLDVIAVRKSSKEHAWPMERAAGEEPELPAPAAREESRSEMYDKLTKPYRRAIEQGAKVKLTMFLMGNGDLMVLARDEGGGVLGWRVSK